MLHRNGARRLALVLCWAISAGCADPKAGSWAFEFACPQLKLHTERVSVSIASGSCAAPGAVLYERALALAEPGPAPAELAPGAYAFSGRAFGTDGRVIGAGCTEVVLPERRDVRVAILDEVGACRDEAEGMDGGLEPDEAASDAATGDAATGDAATGDAATGDGQVDAQPSPSPSCVRFADASASAAPADGLSFATAWPDLQAAVDDAAQVQAEGGCEVWVRAGTYYMYRASSADTLALRAGVALYGGFSGSEATRAERDVAQNPTVLSGLRAAGGSEHVLHVVTGADRALLDGFVISDGRASPATVTASGTIKGLSGPQAEDPAGFGAGMLNIGVSPEVAHCTFLRNSAARCGGAIASSGGNALVRDSVFEGNDSSGSGGAICVLSGALEIRRSEFASNLAGTENGTGGGALYAQAAQLSVADASFYDNASSDDGGAVLLEGASTALLANCTLSANHADSGSGGAVLNRGSTLELVNGIAWGNSPDQLREVGGSAMTTVRSSNVMGGAAGSGNLDLDPGFADAAAKDFRLTATSPCIDAALGSSASSRDLAGHPRVDVVDVANTGSGSPDYADLGALEYQP